jgi:type II secretory pathway component PulC
LPIAALAGACATGPKTGDQLPEGPPGHFDEDESSLSANDAGAKAPKPEAPRPPDTIYRSELERATAGGKPAYLLRELAPEPYRPRGAREGWRIGSVFPSDPGLCVEGCDLFPGDIILTVNGSPLERPEQFSELVSQIGSMTELEVRLVRDGKLHERTYAVVDREQAG